MSSENLALVANYLYDLDSLEKRLHVFHSMDSSLLEVYGQTPLPSKVGALSNNIRKFTSIKFQSAALDLLIYGFVSNDLSRITHGFNALAYGFKFQEVDGSFSSALTDPKEARLDKLRNSSRFISMASLCFQFIQNSHHKRRYLNKVARIKAGLKIATHWLSKNDVPLMQNHQLSPQQLIFDALAFTANGVLLNDAAMITRGQMFLHEAIDLQRHDGLFVESIKNVKSEGEKSNSDVGQQSLTLTALLYYLILVKDPESFNIVLDSVMFGIEWQQTQFLSNGRLKAEHLIANNALSLNDIYNEAVRSFLLYSTIGGDMDSRDIAVAIQKYTRLQENR